MASGTIIATCPVCGDHIWEDQKWCFVNNNIIKHEECDIKNILKILKVIEELTPRERLAVKMHLARIDYINDTN